MHGEFESITVKSAESANVARIDPDGIWIGNGLVSASIQMTDGRPVLTVMDHRPGRKQTGHQIVLSVTEDGAPSVQVSYGDKTVILSGQEIFDKLGA